MHLSLIQTTLSLIHASLSKTSLSISDNGKGSIDVYFDKSKTKKDEEDNHPPRFYG